MVDETWPLQSTRRPSTYSSQTKMGHENVLYTLFFLLASLRLSIFSVP